VPAILSGRDNRRVVAEIVKAPGRTLADPDLGLDLVEFQIELSPRAPPGPRRP
jgi:hypothetical protein